MSKMSDAANTSRLPVDADGGDEMALAVVVQDKPVEQAGGSGSRSARKKRAEPGAAGRQQLRNLGTGIFDGTLIGLPSGWIYERKRRTSGMNSGKIDQFYYEPATGKQFRSYKSTARYLGIEDKDLPVPPCQIVQALKAPSTEEGRGRSSQLQLPPSCEPRSVQVEEHSMEVQPLLAFQPRSTKPVRGQSSEVQPPPGTECHSPDCGRISVTVRRPPGLKPNSSQESRRSTEEQLPPHPTMNMLPRRSSVLQLPRGFKSNYNGGGNSITAPPPPGLEPNSTQEPRGSTEVQPLPAFNLPSKVLRGQSSEVQLPPAFKLPSTVLRTKQPNKVQPPTGFKISSTVAHGQSSEVQPPTGFKIPSTMEIGHSEVQPAPVFKTISTEVPRKKADFDFMAAPEEITWVLSDAKRDIWMQPPPAFKTSLNRGT